MVTAMLRRNRTRAGVCPFDPFRDSRPVTELIAIAFRGRLGPDGEIALAEMRRAARWGPLLGWLYWPGGNGSGVPTGFVWVEQGRVLGNVSLRRALERGGFFIGNVAVHSDWQRRGIASTLMEAALGEISARGGRWVGLEVRADNQAARRIYERLGFREIGRTLCMLRPAGLPWAASSPSHPTLRRGRSGDATALLELMHTIVAISHRPLLERQKRDYRPGWERTLDYWLEGRRETWWVIEGSDGTIGGAVRALHERGRRPDRLEVLVASDYSGRIETTLVQQGIACLRGAFRKMVTIVLPGPGELLVTALEATGFQKVRVLVQMRLDLPRRSY